MLKNHCHCGNTVKFIFIFLFSLSVHAEFDVKCLLKGECNGNWRSSSSNNPSTGSQVRINPAVVPTEVGFGLEGLFYKSEVDVALVRGMGRVGAAISPSNSEETFFGPPGFELTQDYLERKQAAQKLPNQKLTLSTAVNLWSHQGSGLDNYSLKLGLMAKYNKLTSGLTPGTGLSFVWGALSLGGSIYNDETQLKDAAFYPSGVLNLKYQVQTFNVGLFLSSLVLDYSQLTLTSDDLPKAYKVSLMTASLMVNDFILTGARRSEDSDRLFYNFDTKLLETKQIKDDFFGGVQYRINKNIMVGVFYNYYLLREGSFSTTLFF